MAIRLRVERLEKQINIIKKEHKPNYRYTHEDWTREELSKWLFQDDPILDRKAEDTDFTDWSPFLAKLSNDELEQLEKMVDTDLKNEGST